MLWEAAEEFYVCLPFCHTEYEKDRVKGLNLIKWISVTASSKTFLSESDICGSGDYND